MGTYFLESHLLGCHYLNSIGRASAKRRVEQLNGVIYILFALTMAALTTHNNPDRTSAATKKSHTFQGLLPSVAALSS